MKVEERREGLRKDGVAESTTVNYEERNKSRAKIECHRMKVFFYMKALISGAVLVLTPVLTHWPN